MFRSAYLNMIWWKFILVVYLIHHGQALKILGIFHMPAPSHYILGKTYMQALADKGHDVTIISSFDETYNPKNGSYRNIYLDGFKEGMMGLRALSSNFFDMTKRNPLFTPAVMNGVGHHTLKIFYEHPKVQNLLKSGEKFDVFVMEQFMNDGMKYIGYHFNAPTILFSTIGANPWVNIPVGNSAPPSAVANIFLEYSNRMTFKQRMFNSLMSFVTLINFHFFFFPSQDKILHTYFPDAPPLKDLIYNSSLVLLNSHPSIHEAVGLVPNMIDIGGYHVKPPKKLPKDLQDYLDKSKNGVIYFSMGSNLQSAQLPEQMKKAILEAFSELKEDILWKWEEEVLPGQPPNVKTQKWMPQQDILAHPNVKLFITHGGLLSTIETVYHGVPILAIPIFGDQKMNANTAAQSGYGISFNFDDLASSKKFVAAIKELLYNSSYRENVKTRSALMHDRPLSPMDTAIYWTEFVARHNGAPHLRVAALELTWYQYYLLDVILVVLLAIILSITIIVKLIKKVLKLKSCCSSKKAKVKKN